MNQAGKKRDQKKVKVGKKITLKQNQEMQKFETVLHFITWAINKEFVITFF